MDAQDPGRTRAGKRVCLRGIRRDVRFEPGDLFRDRILWDSPTGQTRLFGKSGHRIDSCRGTLGILIPPSITLILYGLAS